MKKRLDGSRLVAVRAMGAVMVMMVSAGSGNPQRIDAQATMRLSRLEAAQAGKDDADIALQLPAVLTPGAFVPCVVGPMCF
jgi:hypothetical protein